MSLPAELFDSLLEPCFILNQNRKVVYCNETAALMAGVSVRKAQRATLDELFSFGEPVEWLDRLSEVRAATPYKEIRFTSREGNEGKVQITCQPLPPAEGAELLWLVFVRDVTLEEKLQQKYRGELEQKEGYILELQRAQQELEKYSKNLEKMVDERTSEIRELNKLMGALLDSLSQGFFVFDKEGLCHDFSSRACADVLEGLPNKRPVWEVLKLPEARVEGFRKWLFTLFADMLPFEDLAPLGPPSYPHSAGKSIKLDYFPLKGDGGIEGVVVVASDVTSLVEAQQQAETERQNALLILNLLNKKQQIARFIRETRQTFTDLESSLARDPSAWDGDEIFRSLHTVKGGCASFNVMKAAHAAHEAENRLAAWKDAPSPEAAEALRAAALETRNSFGSFLEETKRILGPAAFSEERLVEMLVSEVRSLCNQLGHWAKGQNLAESLRRRYLMEPAASFFEPYNDVIARIAEVEGKSVSPIVFENGALPILPEAYSHLFATFVHAFRNAVDHGLEHPSVRAEKGKPESGTIAVSFERSGDRLRIQVRDDGAGIDPLKIRTRLEARGLPHRHESDEQVIQHVFDSSFSTREQISETSGRGVGMDAIRTAAEDLGGHARVTSEVGRGTCLTVDVPWMEDLKSEAYPKVA